MIEALRILNNDPEVKSILVNIFGGILRCDLLVGAIIKATEKYNLSKKSTKNEQLLNNKKILQFISFIFSINLILRF